MSIGNQDHGPNVHNTGGHKEISIHNGTHKGGLAAEGGPHLWAAEGRPIMDGHSFICPRFLHIWSII